MSIIVITPFARVTDVSIAKPVSLTWPKLTERLSKIERKARKEDVPGWAPTLFSPICTCGDEECPGDKGHRIGENALKVFALVLDLDKRSDGTPLDETSARNALRALESMGLRHVVHTTFNHRPPAQVNLRVVVAMSRPVPAEQWEETWRALTQHLGIHVEASCCNADRFWYLPSAPANEETDSWTKVHDGTPLDVDAIMAKATRTNSAEQPTAENGTATLATLAGMKSWMAARYPSARHYQKRGKDCWDIECPWEHEHSSRARKDTVVSFKEGIGGDCGPGFSCLHDHCKGRHWTEFRCVAEPGWHPRARSQSAAADWRTPESVGEHLPSVPPFDRELLPADLRPWVEDIADRMQVSIDFVAAHAMCALSVVAMNARTVKPKRFDPWRVYPNLWGVAIAPPSSMKTPAMKAALKPLSMIEARARETFKAQQAQRDVLVMMRKAQRDAIKKQVEEAVKAGEHVDTAAFASELPEDDAALHRPRRFVTQDSTVEKIQDLVDRGRGHRSYPLGVVRDELLGLLNSFEKDNREGDREFYLEGWGVMDKAVDRVGRGEIFTKDLALVVWGNTTPGPFQAYVREACRNGDGADGFLQRLQMAVYPDPLTTWTPVDRTADRMAERRAVELYERLARIDEDDDEGRPPALRFSDEAQDVFNEWLAQLEQGLRNGSERITHPALVSHFGKYRSLMPGLALLLHLASGPGTEDTPITVWSAQTAIRWCQYLSQHAMRIYSIAAEPYRAVARAIEERICTGKLVGTLKQREIQRALSSYEAKDITDALDLLEDKGWLRVREVKAGRGSKGGRSSNEVDINPKAVKS